MSTSATVVRSLASLSLALVACAGTPHGAAVPRLAADATATDVVTWPVAAAATASPEVAVVVPAGWGDGAPAGLFALRALYLGADDRAVSWGNALSRVARGQPSLGALGSFDGPALVRFTIDRDLRRAVLDWFDAVKGAERLDGTAAAPLDLAATFGDARARWQAYLAGQGAALAAALDEAAAATPGRPLGPEVPTQVEVWFPTWQGDHLIVIHGRRLGRGSELVTPGSYGCSKQYPLPVPGPSAEGPVRPAAPTPEAGAPVMACPPRAIPATVIRRAYQADLALVLEYDRSGRLLASRTYPPHPVPGPGARTTTAP